MAYLALSETDECFFEHLLSLFTALRQRSWGREMGSLR